MNRLILALLVALAAGGALSAQQVQFQNGDGTAGSSLLTSKREFAPAPLSGSAFSFTAESASTRSAALPDAPPSPQVGHGEDFGYRWTLTSGYEYVRFKAAPFSANLSGVHTTVAYSLNDWFAVEGSVVAAFGGTVFSGEITKYALLSGGGRLFWDRAPRKWSPWAHVLVGDVHVNPQIARSSKNGFGIQAGGGVDYFINPRLSLRADGDYVRTQLYSTSQNNFQAGIGFVLHF